MRYKSLLFVVAAIGIVCFALAGCGAEQGMIDSNNSAGYAVYNVTLNPSTGEATVRLDDSQTRSVQGGQLAGNTTLNILNQGTALVDNVPPRQVDADFTFTNNVTDLVATPVKVKVAKIENTVPGLFETSWKADSPAVLTPNWILAPGATSPTFEFNWDEKPGSTRDLQFDITVYFEFVP